MLYQQPAAATKRLLGISRSSSSWPRSNRWAPPLPRPRSSWPRPLTSPCLRPPVSSPPELPPSLRQSGLQRGPAAAVVDTAKRGRHRCCRKACGRRGEDADHAAGLADDPHCRTISHSKYDVVAAAHVAGAVYHQWWTTKTLGPGVIKHVDKSRHSSPLWHCPEKVDAETDSEGGRKLTRLSIDLRILLVFHVSQLCLSYLQYCDWCRIGGIGRH